MRDYHIGDAILTDHGAAFVAAFRQSEEDIDQVGFLIGGHLVWADVEAVTPLDGVS